MQLIERIFFMNRGLFEQIDRSQVIDRQLVALGGEMTEQALWVQNIGESFAESNSPVILVKIL